MPLMRPHTLMLPIRRSVLSGQDFLRLENLCGHCLRRCLHGRRSGPTPTFGSPKSRPLSTQAIASDDTPLRKLLKDEAKQRRVSGGAKSSKKAKRRNDDWELTVGLEIHAQLNTERKLFSSAATSINDTPNAHVAVFDAAFPGSQPQFQKATLIPALRAAVALNCEIRRISRFDRKHYFYQDQPAGYQITQYYEPFAKDGFIEVYDYDGIAPEDGKSIRIGIKQVQMEQDTAKTLQQPPYTHLLDFNRVSHPLIEVITLPHIHHPATAAACVRKIQTMLRFADAVTIGMEMGGLRADVNVSVRRRGSSASPGQTSEYYGVTGLGQRTEIKNLSSFKAVEDAIVAERDRQIEILESGGSIDGETRGWTLGSTETKKLRGKEGEVDYRYMPDPDLGPVIIDPGLSDYMKDSLPEMPDQIIRELVGDGLTIKDAKTLATLDDGDRTDYYRDVIEKVEEVFHVESEKPKHIRKRAGNWVLHELGGLLTTADMTWSENPVSADALADILVHLVNNKITGRTAKLLLSKVFDGDVRSIADIVEEENLLLRPMSREEYEALARELLEANVSIVRQIREKGQVGKIKWFVGQMMRQGEEGRVEAEKAERTLRELLEM
ncbi:MAG: hypothetical protein M1819_006079 [Sarea resinae]|nr:MAG: hypothetical protein M1819_006079 [Sarea resinae]